MKAPHFILAAITLLFTMMTSSCGDDKETISPSLKPSDINLGPRLIEYSAHWLTNGQTLTINIKDLDYSKTVPGVNLSSIKIVKDGEVITTTPYRKNSPINVKVDGWQHGENTLKVIAVFKSNDGEAEKEIGSSNFIVFNELPKYDIEADYRESYCSTTTTDPLTGEVKTNSCYLIDGLTFFFNKEVTNFDAEITKKELHWFTQDGPGFPPDDPGYTDGSAVFQNPTFPIKLYVNFTIIGTHEGIAISQETTIVFSFIRK